MAARRAPRGRKAEEAQAEQAPATPAPTESSPAAAATRTGVRTVVGVAQVVPATRLSAWPRA